jgi:hypothetical protein
MLAAAAGLAARDRHGLCTASLALTGSQKTYTYRMQYVYARYLPHFTTIDKEQLLSTAGFQNCTGRWRWKMRAKCMNCLARLGSSGVGVLGDPGAPFHRVLTPYITTQRVGLRVQFHSLKCRAAPGVGRLSCSWNISRIHDSWWDFAVRWVMMYDVSTGLYWPLVCLVKFSQGNPCMLQSWWCVQLSMFSPGS